MPNVESYELKALCPGRLYGSGDDWLRSDFDRLIRIPRREPVRKRLAKENAKAKSNEIEEAIERSRYILSLPDDYDGEESPRIVFETWQRAISLVRDFDRIARDRFGKTIESPNIDNGSRGGIDIHWKRSGFELLIRIPADPNQRISYYGDDYRDRSTQGTTTQSAENDELVLWILNRQTSGE